ncbi:MAG: ligase-associated DNA damage response endonuclease PdeM [Methyloceanibacter sp.]|uniref:ligase-associated DNA damage response endonuclease PdeM n=1 Tax=Methyloceanibacter sp. TaxID=1965321 RepID=UPI003D9B5595
MLRLNRLEPEIVSPFRAQITVAGHKLKPLASGALYWEAERTLLVADLHLEKGAAFAAFGMLLPPYDTRTTLMRLARIVAELAPLRVVALGDSFHTSQSAARLVEDDLALLLMLQANREWYWIRGNHDPELPECVGGTICNSLSICGITLRHEPSGNADGREISGHLHPVARVARRGEVIRRKCFATDGNRIVMPAFGAYTGGLNVLDAAFGALFLQPSLEAWMMGRADVYPIQGRALLPD